MNRRQFQNEDEIGYELDEASASKLPNIAMAAASNRLLKVSNLLSNLLCRFDLILFE